MKTNSKNAIHTIRPGNVSKLQHISNMWADWFSTAWIRTKSSGQRLINRCATFLYNFHITFATRWSRHVGGKVLSKRDVMFKKLRYGGGRCRKGFTVWQEQRKLYPSSNYYSLVLPSFSTQMITGSNIHIPGHYCRLLPTNVILLLSSCSEVDAKCCSQWFEGNWGKVFSVVISMSSPSKLTSLGTI